jgi:hypothetical protein
VRGDTCGHLWCWLMGGGLCWGVRMCGGGEREIGGLVHRCREMWVPHLNE